MSNYCISCQVEHDTDAAFCPYCGFKLQDKPREVRDALIGQCIEQRYTILDVLGSGGMGMVYRGVQKSVDRPVAIKVLRRELAESPEVIGRFMHEAKIASSLSHPNSVSVFDFGQTADGLLFLVMELLKGQPLSELLKRESLSLRDSLTYVAQVCSAMEEAHLLGIIHRDLKPENIFIVELAKKRFVKVLDFGIAKVLDTHTNLTETGQIFGTPAYMSPEQARGKDLTTQSDIYSLGTVLYEMITNQHVFCARTPVGLLMKHIHDDPVPPSRLDPSVRIPAALESLLLQMLQKLPESRPRSMGELGEEIERIMAVDLLEKNGVASTTDPNIMRPTTHGQRVFRVVTQPGFSTLDEFSAQAKAQMPASTDIGWSTTADAVGPVAEPSVDTALALLSAGAVGGGKNAPAAYGLGDLVAQDVAQSVIAGSDERDEQETTNLDAIEPERPAELDISDVSTFYPDRVQPAALAATVSDQADSVGISARGRKRWYAAAIGLALVISVVILALSQSNPQTESSDESTVGDERQTADASESQYRTIVVYSTSMDAASTIGGAVAGLSHLAMVELVTSPSAEVSVADTQKRLGNTPVHVNLMEEHGPFQIAHQNYQAMTIGLGQLRPGRNEIVLTRKDKGIAHTSGSAHGGGESTNSRPVGTEPTDGQPSQGDEPEVDYHEWGPE